MERVPWSKRVRRWSVAQLVKGLTTVVNVLPLRIGLGLARGMGRIAGWGAGALRRRAEAQMQAALGLTLPEARNLTRRMFEHVGMTALEIACLGKIQGHLAEYVAFSDEDRALLTSAMAQGQGVVFVSGHLGNWELLAQRIVAEGFSAATIIRAPPNPYLTAWLQRRRAQLGLVTIPRGAPGAAKRMLKTLKQGALLGVLIDQDTRVPSVHVPFFGRPASTPVAAAQLAIRRGAPVVVGVIVRRPGGRGHTLRLERVPVPTEGTRAARVVRLTADLSARLEAAIRRHPEQWVWFHDRWRTPPPPSG